MLSYNLPTIPSFVVAIVILTSLIQTSLPIATPIHGFSEVAVLHSRSLNETGISLPAIVHSRRIDEWGHTPKIYLITERTGQPSHLAFKFLHRGPNYEILPIRLGAIALHAFYASIVDSASTVWPRTKRPVNIFTINQGALQLTMSGLGSAIPWAFVEDWAMNAAESVARGWTDTFDAGYEDVVTGITVMVSLRLLDGRVGNGM